MKRTIIEENKKPLRHAFNTVIGIVDKQRDYLTAGFEPNAYNETRFGYMDEEDILCDNRKFMDLSGDGFYNDGEAEPLDDSDASYKGAIAPSANLEYWDVVLVNMPQPIPDYTSVTIHYYQRGILHRFVGMTFGGTGTVRLRPASSADRIYIASIVIGNAYYWDDSSIIDCSLNLRGIETKLEDPELQISEISFEALQNGVPWRIRIADIPDGIPIEYSTGYPGNMPLIRRFYLSVEECEVKNNTVNIKGYDATARLEGEHPGRVIGDPSIGEGAGYLALFEEANRILTNAGVPVFVDHTSWNNRNDVKNGEPVLIPNNISKRKYLASLINVSNFEYRDEYGFKTVSMMYVDAGRPRLITDRDTSPAEIIRDVAELTIVPERRINRIEINNPYVDYGSRRSIEKYDNSGKTMRTLDKPYVSMQASRGTLSQLNPYTFTLKGSGEIEVTGIPVRNYDPSDSGSDYTPRVSVIEETGRTAVMNTFFGMQANVDSSSGLWDVWEEVLANLINRSNELFKFRWRGNPNLNPRDVIDVNVNGTITTMTIESIEVSHKDGGYQQSIVARGGIV